MKPITRALVAAISLAAAGAFAQGQGSGQQGRMQSGTDSGGSQKMKQSMMEGMKDMQSMKMTGDTDRDFATMMRMHHEKGIEMAQAEISHGQDEKMKSMARKIVEDQRKDNKEFDDWLKSRK